MIGALQTHAKSRGLLAGGVALVALVLRLGAEAPPPRSVEGVADLLGRAAGASVKPDDFLWEERGGFLHDAFVGRRVLFLASPRAAGSGAPRDLFRARVRLTRAGRPISATDVRNLTRTPLGDDRDLTGAGHHVAFATSTAEGVQGITVLDLAGQGPPAPGARALTWIDRWLATGSTRGLARTEIAFERPPEEAKLEVGPTALVMALGSEGVPAAFDFAASSLQTGRTNTFAAAAQSLPELPRPPSAVLTDLVARTLGPAPATLLRAVARGSSRLALAASAEAAAPAGLRIAADYPIEGGWPPAPLAPPHPKPFDGEGFWHVAPAIQSADQQVAPPLSSNRLFAPTRTIPTALFTSSPSTPAASTSASSPASSRRSPPPARAGPAACLAAPRLSAWSPRSSPARRPRSNRWVSSAKAASSRPS